MRAHRDQEAVVVTLLTLESQLLQGALEALLAGYPLQPGELDAKTASVWYSSEGCRTAKMSEEETAEWLGALHSMKGQRISRIEGWLGILKSQEPSPERQRRLRIEVADAPDFLGVINDYRLLAAARHDIGELEMSERSLADHVFRLPAEKARALLEIDLLAWIMESILRCLDEAPPSGETAE